MVVVRHRKALTGHVLLVLEHALRSLFAYLHAVVIPTGVFAVTDDYAGTDLDLRITRAAAELAALMGKVSRVDSAGTKRRTAKDEFANVTLFEELLRATSAAG